MIALPAVGDRVAYARGFVRAMGSSLEMAAKRGRVTVVTPLPNVNPGRALVRVLWDGEQESTGSLNTNLVAVDRLPLEPN